MADDARSRLSSSETEESLIGRVRLRDQEALAEIYDRFASIVYTIALRVLCEESAAEEVTREVFLHVWRIRMSTTHYFALGRASEAEKIIRRASERGFNPPEMLFLRYSIAFRTNNSDDMNRVVALSQGKPWAEDWITQAQALTAADAGQLELARKLSQRAVDIALRAQQPDRAAGYEASFALYQAVIGYPREAIDRASAALKLSRGRDIEYTAGLARGMAGDLSQAEELSRDLQSRFPEDTVVNRFYLLVLRAVIAMKQRTPKKLSISCKSLFRVKWHSSGMDLQYWATYIQLTCGEKSFSVQVMHRKHYRSFRSFSITQDCDSTIHWAHSRNSRSDAHML